MEKSLYNIPLYSPIYHYASHQGIVQEGLNTLRISEESVDVILIVEGESFNAHKVVLSACSDFFRAMFTHNMIETRQKEIQLIGLNAKTFFLVLEYAYTSRISLNLSNVKDVLQAAAYLQILSLTHTCSSFLEAKINNNNYVDIATIAETYLLPDVKMKVYRFMTENLSSLSKTWKFYSLTPSQLKTLLAHDSPVDCPEDEVLKIVSKYFFYKLDTRSKVDISEVTQIFQQIRFSDIPLERIHTILKEVNENQRSDWELFRIGVCEIYNQLSKEKSSIATSLLKPRGMELAVLKIGGSRTPNKKITYKFPSESKWKHLTELPPKFRGQNCYGTAVLNNDLFIIVGCDQFRRKFFRAFGFKYNAFNNKWYAVSPMKVERYNFSLNVVDGKMYAIGGVIQDRQFDTEEVDETTGTCECYDPVTDEWTEIKPLPVGITGHAGAACELSSKLFISGGKNSHFGDCINSTYCYDVKNGLWTTCTPMLTPRIDHVMLSIDSCLYVCGGWQMDNEQIERTLVKTIDVYDVEKNTWNTVTEVPTPRYKAGIVSVSRKIYFIGGLLSNDTAADSIECYDVENDFWSTEEKYPEAIPRTICCSLYISKYQNGMDVMPQ